MEAMYLMVAAVAKDSTTAIIMSSPFMCPELVIGVFFAGIIFYIYILLCRSTEDRYIHT